MAFSTGSTYVYAPTAYTAYAASPSTQPRRCCLSLAVHAAGKILAGYKHAWTEQMKDEELPGRIRTGTAAGILQLAGGSAGGQCSPGLGHTAHAHKTVCTLRRVPRSLSDGASTTGSVARRPPIISCCLCCCLLPTAASAVRAQGAAADESSRLGCAARSCFLLRVLGVELLHEVCQRLHALDWHCVVD